MSRATIGHHDVRVHPETDELRRAARFFLPKLVVTFLRICERFPWKETSNALHLPSFAFLGIKNSRSCLFVCFALFVLSFLVYLTILSVARYMHSVNWQDD